MGASQRVLAALIVVLLGAGVGAAIVKGNDEEPLTIEPTTSPTPSETFTFPGPVPTETETPLFPTATETAAGPEMSPGEGEELPRTGGGSLLWPATLTLALAIGAGVLVRRTARSVS